MIKYLIKTIKNILFQVLSVPASSATCERVFSSAGQVCSKRRGRLSPERIEQLTILKINQKKIDDFKKVHDINKIDAGPPYFCGSSTSYTRRDDLEESDLGSLYKDLSEDEDEDEVEVEEEEEEEEDEEYCEIGD